MNAPMDIKQKGYGKRVLIYFLLFFGLIIAVNSVFIYIALSSFTGVITDKPYEKGLGFNETLAKAESQPKMNDTALYEDGLLKWALKNSEGSPIDNANVNASLVRPVKDGYDYEVALEYTGNGQYEAILNLPLKGQWQAHLKASWNNTQYQTTYSFQAK